MEGSREWLDAIVRISRCIVQGFIYFTNCVILLFFLHLAKYKHFFLCKAELNMHLYGKG